MFSQRPVIDQRGSASILSSVEWDPMATKLRKSVEKRDELSVQWRYIYIYVYDIYIYDIYICVCV